MELSNQFEVGVPVERAWEVFTDLEAIVPCLPGARLTEAEGDEYRGTIKVKVGSVTASYIGTIKFIEQNRDTGRLILAAEGKDARGRGTANATITAELTPSGDGTAVLMTTDMIVTGIVAQFGRGIMADVSKRLIGQFAERIEQRIADPNQPTNNPADTNAHPNNPTTLDTPPAADPNGRQTTGSAAGAVDPATDAGTAKDGSGAIGANVGGTPTTTVRRIDSAEAAPVELGGVAAGALTKRAAWAAGGTAALVLLIQLIRRLAS